MDGGETSFHRITLRAIKQVPKGEQPSRRMQLKKSNCRNTGDGARVQESLGTVAGQAPLLREEDA